jgi:CRISPR-associated protein Cmr3
MIRASNRFTVSLLSPLCLPQDSSGRLASPMPGQTFPGLTGSTVVSACVGRPVHIGGWNSLKREPLPLIPYLPAGSTWFCEAEPAALDCVLALHGRHVGERTPYGFGQIALGAWPQETGDTA